MVTFDEVKLGKRVSLYADIAGIILFFIFFTGWTMQDILCNPYTRVLSYTLLFTLLAYSIPFIRLRTFAPFVKWLLYALLALIAVTVIMFYPKSKCTITTTEVAAAQNTSPKNGKIPDTAHIDKAAPSDADLPRVKGHPPKSIEPETGNKPSKPGSSKSASKFDLRGAQFQGPTQVGDSNTQNITLINGNVYFTADRILSDAGLNWLIRVIENKRKEFQIQGNKIFVMLTMESKEAKMVHQIKHFLVSKGYDIDPATAMETLDFEGITIREMPDHTAVGIVVGVL